MTAVRAPSLTAAPAGQETLSLKVTYQGCAEAGLCYNPISKTVALQMGATPLLSAATARAQQIKDIKI